MPRAIALSLAAFCFFPVAAHASVLYVPLQFADVPIAIAAAQSGDIIRVELPTNGSQPNSSGYNFGNGVDFAGKSIQLDFNGLSYIEVSRTAIVTLANASSIQFDNPVVWGGTLVVPAGATASMSTSSRSVEFTQFSPQFVLGAGSSLTLAANNLNLSGSYHLGSDASLFFSQALSGGSGPRTSFYAGEGSTLSFPLNFSMGGTLTSLGGSLQTDANFTFSTGTLSVVNGSWIGADIRLSTGTFNISNSALVARSLILSGPASRLAGSGQWFVDLTVSTGAQATFLADSTVTGAYQNMGRTVVQSGRLIIAGSLTNSGQIVGDYLAPRGPGETPSFSVFGDFYSGPETSMTFPGGEVRITGNADIAIASGLNFDLQSATLLVGEPGATVTLEALSDDAGPAADAFSPSLGAFPIGTLTVNGAVRLVDDHENGSPQPDAIYVQDLRIPAGASLLTGSHRIYYRTLTNAGRVDNLANLIHVPSCAADIDRSGTLTIHDLFGFVAAYFAGDPIADVNHSGGVTVQDVFDYLTAYFAGCP